MAIHNVQLFRIVSGAGCFVDATYIVALIGDNVWLSIVNNDAAPRKPRRTHHLPRRSLLPSSYYTYIHTYILYIHILLFTVDHLFYWKFSTSKLVNLFKYSDESLTNICSIFGKYLLYKQASVSDYYITLVLKLQVNSVYSVKKKYLNS